MKKTTRSNSSKRQPPKVKPVTTRKKKKGASAARIRILAREIFSSDEAVDQWLRTRNPVLGDRTPMALMTSPSGAKRVHSHILSVIHGTAL